MEKIKNTHRWLVFMCCGLMIMLNNIDLTIVNLSLPSIANSLNADLNHIQWVIVSYLLATAACLTLFGKLADDFGKKHIFLFGVILFILGSLLAGITSKLFLLVAARFIQGLGFAATLGLALVIILESFPEEKKGYITGLAVTIGGLSQASGPIVGGIILQYFSWHWVFLINLPFGLISLLVGSLVIKADSSKISLKNINVFNVLSFISSICLTLYFLNQIPLLLNNIKSVAILLVAILVSIALFIYTSLKFSKPLIDLSLLKNTTYIKINLIRLIFMTAMASLLFIIPLYLQNIIGFMPLSISKILLFMTLMVALLAPLTGKILDRIGFKYPLLLSLVSMILVLLLMLTFGANISWFILPISLVLFGVAIGIHTPASINGALSSVSTQKKGTAIGFFYTIAVNGAIFGVALCGGLINSMSEKYLISGGLTQQLKAKAVAVAKGVQSASEFDQMPNIKLMAQHAFLNAFHIFLKVEIVFFVAAVILCLSLKKNLYN